MNGFQVSRHPWPVVAFASTVAGFVLRVLSPSTIYFNIHAERDLWRGLLMLRGEQFFHAGSELTQGGYTPGPAMYLLEMPALLFTTDPRGVLVWLALMHAVALWFTFLIGREHFSPKVGAAAAALFATFPLATLALRYLWNPSYIFPFAVLVFWGLAHWVLRRKPGRMPLVFASIFILIQIHISATALLLLVIVLAAVYRPPFPKKVILCSVGVSLLVMSPYLVGELFKGFENTRAIVSPPEALITANEAVIPIGAEKRVMLNTGALKALQVNLAPVMYDRRLETGSFSYLMLLGERGWQHVPSVVWQMARLANALRWPMIACFGAGLCILAMIVLLGRDGGVFVPVYPVEDEKAPGTRGRALFLLLCIAVPPIPSIFAGTMTWTVEGEVIGIGAARYFFVLYPMQFLLYALLARGASHLFRGLAPRVAPWIGGVAVGVLCVLQATMLLAYLATARAERRSFTYSVYHAFDWSVQREAAGALIQWGVTPDQFRHRMTTLDGVFDSQRWDIPSLEMGLDYAYFTHPDLQPNVPPTYPESFFAIYDAERSPDLDESKLAVEDRYAAGGLILLRLAEGEEKEVSPIQNTWERLRVLE